MMARLSSGVLPAWCWLLGVCVWQIDVRRLKPIYLSAIKAVLLDILWLSEGEREEGELGGESTRQGDAEARTGGC